MKTQQQQRRRGGMTPGRPVIYDAHNRPIPLERLNKQMNVAGIPLFGGGFKGANDENLMDWALLPLQINTILRNDLAKLRARSRDLARNDDTAKRFLYLVKQNVLGPNGIQMQARNKQADGKTLDEVWNNEIESEWALFSRKRRVRGQFESPSVDGQMSLREVAWLALWNKVIDGEVFIQILRGYPHNRHRFAVRFLNPDLLDSGYSETKDDGSRIEMGIEFDEFERPIAYHFTKATGKARTTKQERERIPSNQIIHLFRNEYIGQIRGIPEFAGIMHKAKMLNGVHEAVVVGWRVAAAKMGFFSPKDPGADWDGETTEDGDRVIDAVPGSFEVLQNGYEFSTFDPDYPSSTYEAGHRCFMQQMANGLNISAPTLSNDYSRVNYSSLRQAALEDRDAWRCIQAEMIDGFYQPLFDEWFDWQSEVMGRVSSQDKEPIITWQPRGWAWVDPTKEVQAHILAIGAHLRTRQSIIAESCGSDFVDTADALADEQQILIDRGLPVGTSSDTKESASQDEEASRDDATTQGSKDNE